MRWPPKFLVWSGLLTFCVLFWVWVVGLIVDACCEQPVAPPAVGNHVIRAQVVAPDNWRGTMLDIRVTTR